MHLLMHRPSYPCHQNREQEFSKDQKLRLLKGRLGVAIITMLWHVLEVTFMGALLKFRVTGLSDTGNVEAWTGRDFAA